MAKFKSCYFIKHILCSFLLIFSSCTNLPFSTGDITPSSATTPSKTSSQFLSPIVSITPAVVTEPAEIHPLALNEGNIYKIENLSAFGSPNRYCIHSAIDTALETRFINGQVEYLLARTDFENRNIQIWDLEKEVDLQTFKIENVDSVVFSPDRRTLISFHRYGSGTLTLWDIESGNLKREVVIEPNHYYGERIIISQDGSRIAVFSCLYNAVDCRVSEFNLQTNQVSYADYFFPLYGETPPPYIYSPSGNLVSITYNNDNKLHFLDLTNHKDTILEFPFSNLNEIAMAEAVFSTMAVSSNETYIAGGAENGDIYLWDSAVGTLLKILKAHTTQRGDGWSGAIQILEFSPKSNLLLSVGYDGFTKLWDAKTGILAKEINTCHHCGGFTQDGRYLVTVGGKGIEVWGIP